MSLTMRQRITLASVLCVPYAPTINRLQDVDNLLVNTYTPTSMESFWANTRIDERLTQIAAVPELEADLVYCLDRWYDLFGDSTEMVSGSTGGTAGVSFNLNNERAQLRERILAIIPFSKDFLADELGRVNRERLSMSVIR